MFIFSYDVCKDVSFTRKVQKTANQGNFDLYCKEVEGVTGETKRDDTITGASGNLLRHLSSLMKRLHVDKVQVK